jgi:hypothetical protein
MGLLMTDTNLIDLMLNEALRALDHLSDSADVLDLGYGSFERELDDRAAPQAPSANLLTWPHHLISAH